MLHSHIHLAKFKAHWIITSLFKILNTRAALSITRITIEIIIKGSFTDNFYPFQAFPYGGIENFSSSVMSWVSSKKNKNETLQNVFCFSWKCSISKGWCNHKK